MKFQLGSTVFAFLLLQFGCSSPTVESVNQLRTDGKDSIKLVAKDTLSLGLDSVTTTFFAYIQYHQPSNSLFLLNRKAQQIYQFSLENRREVGKVTYQKEGPDGIGAIEGFYYHNSDSIFTYDRRYNRVSLINKFGKMRQTKVILKGILDLDEKYCPFPQIQTKFPMLFDKSSGKIFFVGYQSGEHEDDDETNRKVLVEYDPRSHIVRTSIPYPSLYSGEINWGGEHFRDAFFNPNWQDSLLVFSFPASHDLVIHRLGDPANVVTSRYAGSQKIDKITALPPGKTLNADDNFEKYFLETPSYGSVIYDPYRELYYRFAHLPIPEHKRQPGKFDKQVGIVVLNRAFAKVGEVWFEPFTFSSSQYFVSPDGLFLESYQKSEDFFRLGRFLPEKVMPN
jgi:hypothetical protein